jgi:hypothetical protein
MRTVAVAAAFLAALAPATHGYTHVVQSIGSRLVRLSWPVQAQPVRMLINDQTGPQLGNVGDGSDPLAALDRALAAWPAVANIRIAAGSTPIASGGRDGASIISFAATQANLRYFEMAGDPIGLTLYFFENDALTEADVLFNPQRLFTTTAGDDEELRRNGQADVEAVAVHELGHAIGLNHTGVESASMWGFTSLAQRELDADDVTGAQALYPLDEGSTLVGSVRVGGAPAFGAHVVAVSAAGGLRSALTLPDGTYRIERLPPGSYTAYVEPLDGPHASAFADGCVQFGNMGGAGIFDGAVLTTDFRTTFYGGNHTPVVLTLTEGHSVLANFELASGSPTLNPVRIGPGTPSGGFERLAEFALQARRGTEQWVAIAGPGLDLVSAGGIRIAGAGVAVDASAVQRLSVNCGDQTLPALVFRAEIAANAGAGGRSILLDAGGEVAAFTGAIRIASAPGTCAGDCDQDGRVTIDELLRAVAIALGIRRLEECPGIDADGDGVASVPDLVAAVDAMLDGCE